MMCMTILLNFDENKERDGPVTHFKFSEANSSK